MLKLSLIRKSVVKISDRADMTSAAYHEHKVANQSILLIAPAREIFVSFGSRHGPKASMT